MNFSFDAEIVIIPDPNIINSNFFSLGLENTGESHLIIFSENITNLENGDEVFKGTLTIVR